MPHLFLNNSVKHWPILILLGRQYKKNDANDCSFVLLTLMLPLHYLVKCKVIVCPLTTWIITG